MLHALALPFLLLQLIAHISTEPIAASSLNVSPGDTLLDLASRQTPPPHNASTVTRYPVERSPITLFIQTIPNEKIPRTDLVTALYDSRDYIQQRIKTYGNSSLAAIDDPFNSTAHANVRCVLVAGTGPGAQQRLTYGDLGDVVQGLMDTMFLPYRAKVDGVTFAVYHAVWGFVGSGALTTGVGVKSA